MLVTLLISQDFCRMAPNGYDVLREDVRKLFRQDDAPPNFDAQETQPLSEIMQVCWWQ